MYKYELSTQRGKGRLAVQTCLSTQLYRLSLWKDILWTAIFSSADSREKDELDDNEGLHTRRVGDIALYGRILLFQECCNASKSSPSARRAYETIDFTARLLPDLGACRLPETLSKYVTHDLFLCSQTAWGQRGPIASSSVEVGVIVLKVCTAFLYM